MKLFLFSIVLVCIGLEAKCDTLHYWNVYLNQQKIATLNQYQTDTVLNLKRSPLKNSDTLWIEYTSCAKCVDCVPLVLINIDEQHIATSGKNLTTEKGLPIALNAVLNSKNELFTVYYYPHFETNQSIKEKLFALKIE